MIVKTLYRYKTIADVLDKSSSVENLVKKFQQWFPSFLTYLDKFGIKGNPHLYDEGGKMWTKVLIARLINRS